MSPIESITIIGGRGKDGEPEPVERVELKMGNVASIVGPTGSGKTTLINDPLDGALRRHGEEPAVGRDAHDRLGDAERESGTVGVYHADGAVKEGLIEEISDAIDPGRLLFEAPAEKQQVWFIKHFGSDVNLGSIALEEVISVETLRLGLRGNTLLHFH